MIIISKLTYKFIFSFQTKLYLKVARKLLHQDYLFFVDKGVGQINNVLSLEIRNYCAKVVASMILLVREFMIVLGILTDHSLIDLFIIFKSKAINIINGKINNNFSI